MSDKQQMHCANCDGALPSECSCLPWSDASAEKRGWPANWARIVCRCGMTIGGYETGKPPGALVLWHGCGQITSLDPSWPVPDQSPLDLAYWFGEMNHPTIRDGQRAQQDAYRAEGEERVIEHWRDNISRARASRAIRDQPPMSPETTLRRYQQWIDSIAWCIEHKTTAFFCWDKPHTCHCGDGEAYWRIGNPKPVCATHAGS